MLTRALAKGRADKGVPRSRAAILLALLRKRAEAHRHGLIDHEQKLRDQITWSLPIEEPVDADQGPNSNASNAACARASALPR